MAQLDENNLKQILLRYVLIDVDGVPRSRLNSENRPIDVSDEGVRDFWRWFGDSKAVDDTGRPLVVYHGTAANFDEFSATSHRSVLNNEYHGDGFHFSPEESVAEKYANANRNQFFNKRRMFDAVDKKIPEDLADLFKSVVENGYEEAWELPDGQIRHLIDLAKSTDIDINDLLALTEYVEGTNYNKGREQSFDAGMIFGSGAIYLPDWAVKDAIELGLEEAVPVARVVAAYLKTENLLHTKSQSAASKAEGKGYDGVFYSGKDLVDQVPEWVIFHPSQIKSIDNIGNWLSNDDRYQMPGAPTHMTQMQASMGLCSAIEGGKNEGIEVDYKNPTREADGSGWVRVSLPLDLIWANSNGEYYNSSVDPDLANKYAEQSIPTPIHLEYSEGLHRNGIDVAFVRDGAHRVSAARIRGDEFIPAIMQRSQYRQLLEANELTLDPCVQVGMKKKSVLRAGG
jgi:hypothetical protein